MKQVDHYPVTLEQTIHKTLLTARLMDGFWDRWKAHGVLETELSKIRPLFTSKDNWIEAWRELGEQKLFEARHFIREQAPDQAEIAFRTAGLYFQFNQWLLPEMCQEKTEWLNTSLQAFQQADALSEVEAEYVRIPFNEQHQLFGRIRLPKNPKGVLLFINPFDSIKEELFTYEMDFVTQGYITVSFDGPGQGQTYSYQGLRATTENWQTFVDTIIAYASQSFGHLPLYLFGTSSGASWALYGSCSSLITKAVAVSPAFPTNDISGLPDYFIERNQYLMEKEAGILPPLSELIYQNPILLAHGRKDVMVADEKVYSLLNQLPIGHLYLEYEDEGHCCNYKLPEIRKRAMAWFQEEGMDNDI
ncbi:hypothetical protein GCM10011391_05410 [Pullulanibacillus camelliae]|uniref:Serine aminopeptidase S33 domain-containing protein n=1 Tax=Pullulanibacillus camelliae TaxID=1707096 RepID=A0A8J2VKN6_9BACL|nr:alpha/beta hydrolase [Pullulanibacillus camelliae]GGE29813.1 hypothetical protein GCM10011391_05410 [Pullulanibacillus camelliae]